MPEIRLNNQEEVQDAISSWYCWQARDVVSQLALLLIENKNEELNEAINVLNIILDTKAKKEKVRKGIKEKRGRAILDGLKNHGLKM